MGQGEGVKRSSGSVVPAVITSLFAVIQLAFTAIIFGLEAGSISYDAGRGTVYAGFWCSIVFFVTWVSMLGSICCGKSVGCRIYLIIINILSLAFAIILIVFTARFKNNPCLCYGILCEVPSWECIRNEYCIETIFGSENSYYCTQRTLDKVPILKALLAFAILMLISNVVFILVTIVLLVFQRRKKSVPHKIPEPIPRGIPSTAPVTDGNLYEPGSRPQSYGEPTHYYSDNSIPFQHVQPSAPMNIRSQKF